MAEKSKKLLDQVRAAILETQSPAEVMRRVNDLLIPDTQHGMFVTAVYAVLCLQTGELTFANAGHNPPLWVQRKTGKIERLTRTGMALGVVEKLDVEQCTIHLEPDDCLLFYTDGLTEAFAPDGDIFGEGRLTEVLSALPVVTANQMLDTVEKAVMDFMDSLPPGGDLTMLTVRRLQ